MRVPLGRGPRAALLVFLLAAAGCEDIRRFSGSWAGEISPDPAHQQGFGPDVLLRAEISSVSRAAIEMTLDLPGASGPLPFLTIRHTSDDVLGDATLDGNPLRTYFGYLEPGGVVPYLAVVSLFPDDRVDVRIIRGSNETYGVFSLRRTLGGTGADR